MLSPAEWDAVRLSLKVAGWAIAVGLPLAVALAWVLARKRFPGRLLLESLLYAPLVVPPVVVGYLLLVTFGRTGPVGGLLYEWFGISLAFTWRGAAVAAGIMAFPLMLRAVRLAFEAQDLGLEAAARTLGAGPARVFATITLPLALPGVVAASVLGFARALGEFGATITFVSNIPGLTQTLPLAVYTAAQTPGGEASAARLAVLSLIIAVAAVVASEVLARRWRPGRTRA